jgi:pSer/pThr/pTyr-binding forkhead associated (FHA) protein
MSPVTASSLPAHDDTQLTTEVLAALPRLSHRGRRQTVPADRPAPGRYLEIEDGEQRALLPLQAGTTRIGRSFAADVHLDDQSVSRRHAILFARPTGTRVLDDRSANGTFVNGRRITEALLRDGDVLVIGRIVLTYRHVR